MPARIIHSLAGASGLYAQSNRCALYMTYASDWGMRRTLAQIKKWELSGLIDAPQASRLRDRAIDWYMARRF